VLIVVLAMAGLCACGGSADTAAVAPLPVLRVDTRDLGAEFAPGAVGLSTETQSLGAGYITAARRPLVRLMKLLGPSVLRIGGDSVDRSWWTSRGEPAPAWATNTVTPEDLQILHGLMVATGWRALLGVDLGHFEPARAAEEARYAEQTLGGSLLGIEIGNEPNDYDDVEVGLRPTSYDVQDYINEVETYRQALSQSAPGVAIYGPALGQNTNWLSRMGGGASMFAEITQHFYATSTCPGSAPAVAPTVTGLLSPAERQLEDAVLEKLTLAGNVADRPTRIGETNNTACLGEPSVSSVFASALWALDWSLRAASSGVRGLNFHGGLSTCTSTGESPICSLSRATAHPLALTAQPEYYGMLAARQLEGGRFVPTRLLASAPSPNLVTWATLTPGGTLRIAIENLARTRPAQPLSLSIPGYTATGQETLTAPSAGAGSEIAFGSTAVTLAGRWRPRPAKPAHIGRLVYLLVRPASAVILTLHRVHSRG
jgi:hypothetical protein